MKKPLITLVTLAATLLAGCGTAPGAIAPRAAAPVAAQAPAKTLKALPAEATRRLMQVAEEVPEADESFHWAFYFRSTWMEGKVVEELKSHRLQGRVMLESEFVGSTYYHKSHWRSVVMEKLGWRKDIDFAGMGDVQQHGNGVFTYEVPAGRILVINRVELPQNVRINGVAVGIGSWARPTYVEEVNYVFGPGEIVDFDFRERGVDPGFLRLDRPAALSGMVVDPALLGGSLPQGLLSGSAK